MNSSSNKSLSLAISTCPNDTFAFHGILAGKVDCKGLNFDIQLLDIQQLNDGLFANKFDVAKASFHAAALLTGQTVVLPSGSALGFGVGPLLLAAEPNSAPGKILPETANPNVTSTLCPGKHTTAAMLFQLFYSQAINSGQTKVSHELFSAIMPALQQKAADFGVCIHEGRFTWASEGLFLVEDLGTRWEKETASPLPLGGVLARRDLGGELIGKIQSVIQASIKYGLENPDEAIATMREYAQEFDDTVLMKHVDLYVNQWTVELGDVGAKALHVLSTKAKECGLIPAGSQDIEVFRDNKDLKI